MKILRLGSSSDRPGRLPEGALSYQLAEQRLAQELGEPVETVVRTIWPNAALPPLVEDWVEAVRSDLVFLKVPAYSFTYESVPLKVERRLGRRVGRPVARAGLKAADTPWIAHTRLFHLLRRLAQRTIGGATHFEPEEVAERIESCIRIIVRNESITLVVRGPRGQTNYHAGRAARDRAEARRLYVHKRLETLCRDLHVDYVGVDTPLYRERKRSVLGDRLHPDTKQHAVDATYEADVLLAAWQRHHRPAPT